MNTSAVHDDPGAGARLRTAPAVVVLIWAGYTVLQTLAVTGHVSEMWAAILGFVPGLLGIAVLRANGLGREQLFLRVAPLSLEGFWILAGIMLLGLAVITHLASGRGGTGRRP